MTRICITGGPRTGKTTLSRELFEQGHRDFDRSMLEADGHVRFAMYNSPTILHTDSLIGLHDWSGCSEVACGWLDAAGPWIIEGVAVSRALRKWRDAHPGEPPPVDRVIYLQHPHETLTKAQAAMAKGVLTVHQDIEPWLEQHNIRTEYR